MLGLFTRKKTTHGASAVVTGAGSGIGAAFAVELARRGGAVVCSDIDEAAATKTAETIAGQGGKALAIGCDVSEFDDVRQLADQSQSWFGAAPHWWSTTPVSEPAARPSAKPPLRIGAGH
ncbi:short chain dehydrogenase family protein [Mycobacterium xenopi 4042]|uniref:Short chain dehydrogenase family protein n=1 Tax=Mycobacterium xenopi 4042 TaxID=1299334 RepID=X8AP11_MYCXE|nr:short chain dehydrogenase family protein [Mycobacterium xenopi 3993]EUA33324.1 short chain dehydrogenase family protein [Mycobacterium xenopi 4042]